MSRNIMLLGMISRTKDGILEDIEMNLFRGGSEVDKAVAKRNVLDILEFHSLISKYQPRNGLDGYFEAGIVKLGAHYGYTVRCFYGGHLVSSGIVSAYQNEEKEWRIDNHNWSVILNANYAVIMENGNWKNLAIPSGTDVTT